MEPNVPQWFSSVAQASKHLSRILAETNRFIRDLDEAGFFRSEMVDEELLEGSTKKLKQLERLLDGSPVLVLMGQSCESRAHFVNTFLGTVLLPTTGGNWRWVRIAYGPDGHATVTVGLKSIDFKTNKSHSSVVPKDDLERSAEGDMVVDKLAVVEIKVCNIILRDGTTILVVPNLSCTQSDERGSSFSDMIKSDLNLPIFVFALDQPCLSQQDEAELREVKQLHPDSPIFFISSWGAANARFGSGLAQDLTELEQRVLEVEQLADAPSQAQEMKRNKLLMSDSENRVITKQLENLGFSFGSVSIDSSTSVPETGLEPGRVSIKSCLVDGLDRLNTFHQFAEGVCRAHVAATAGHLSKVHAALLQKFIFCAFDKAREIQITPSRMRYALHKEVQLYQALTAIAAGNETKVIDVIDNTLHSMGSEFIEAAAQYQYQGSSISTTNEIGPKGTPEAIRLATAEIQQLVMSRLIQAVANRLVRSVNGLHDSVVGTLFRTLHSLERIDRAHTDNTSAEEHDFPEFPEQQTTFFDIFSHTESSKDVNSCSRGPQPASDALKKILSAAYSVQVCPLTSSYMLHEVLERLRQVLFSVQLPWITPSRLNAAWRRQVATRLLQSLSPKKLAMSITSQFSERVRTSHYAFLRAWKSLAKQHAAHLEECDEQRIGIREHHAPILSRLALLTTSLADLACYGMPELGKEIGRGQFGVVFSCESWGGQRSCAVKSVIPTDDKQWNDLAMEFYYTRAVPEHPRIVKLRGTIIDYSYGTGCFPAVLLVTDRLTRDLESALCSGLAWLTRLQIATDVVEGIRYLHSQGLVHRDVKLSNVLLDCHDRGKLTDFGFCISEAMVAGSVVGTPIHMAPEMHSRYYDSRVDIYAFGVLFWYICAGSVELPLSFSQCRTKEQLWTYVRRGIRPQKLDYFDCDCWQLMEECWNGDPEKRPLLGLVQVELEKITKAYVNSDQKERHLDKRREHRKYSTVLTAATVRDVVSGS